MPEPLIVAQAGKTGFALLVRSPKRHGRVAGAALLPAGVVLVAIKPEN